MGHWLVVVVEALGPGLELELEAGPEPVQMVCLQPQLAVVRVLVVVPTPDKTHTEAPWLAGAEGEVEPAALAEMPPLDTDKTPADFRIFHLLRGFPLPQQGVVAHEVMPLLPQCHSHGPVFSLACVCSFPPLQG